MSAVAEIQPMFFDEDGGHDLDIQFDPKQFEAVTPYSDDLEDEYQAAQDRLKELRQQEEQIRRQAEELEELSRKEELFKEGRAEVTEQLNRYLALLDREATEAQRLAEDCGEAHERLESHLATMQRLRPETWSRSERKSELARALSHIEAAEDEIDNVMPLIESFGGSKKGLLSGKLPSMRSTPFSQNGDFLYWLKSGFAFSLPLVGFAVLAIVLFLVF